MGSGKSGIDYHKRADGTRRTKKEETFEEKYERYEKDVESRLEGYKGRDKIEKRYEFWNTEEGRKLIEERKERLDKDIDEKLGDLRLQERRDKRRELRNTKEAKEIYEMAENMRLFRENAPRLSNRTSKEADKAIREYAKMWTEAAKLELDDVGLYYHNLAREMRDLIRDTQQQQSLKGTSYIENGAHAAFHFEKGGELRKHLNGFQINTGIGHGYGYFYISQTYDLHSIEYSKGSFSDFLDYMEKQEGWYLRYKMETAKRKEKEEKASRRRKR